MKPTLTCLFFFLLLVPLLPAQAQTTSTTTLAVSSNPSTFGQNITLTATITGSASTGTVTFMDGSATLGSATLADSANTQTVNFALNTLTAGSHSLTAAYAGDANNAASTSAALNLTVNKASTTSTIATSGNDFFGRTVTFTVTVNGVAPTGVVTFKDSSTVMGTGTLAGNGNSRTATFATATLAVGTHFISAVYAGDANNNNSTSSSLTQFIVTLPTTTTLASSLNPSTFGQTVTFTATINGGSNPSGIITFRDFTPNPAVTLGTATLANATASFSTSALPAGAHSISAGYSGDTNNGSSSITVTQNINKLPTTTALASSLNPAVAGQSVTLTASVTGSAPTGTVTFKDGAATLGTGTLSAGTASLSTKFTAGTHSLTVVYAGDANNAASTSAPLAQTVNLTATSLTLSATPNPTSSGQNVTLVARIEGGFNSTGVVTFSEGATTLGTANASAGAATFSTNSLAQGSHSISAAYAGDVSNPAASSAALSLSVNARAGYTWQYGWDAMGRPKTVIDPNGQASYLYYDSLGRATQIQQPANNGSSTPTVIGYGYDLRDSLTSITDPRNLATNYSPNGLAQTTSQTSPDAGAASYSYDARGNLLASTDARGKQTSYSYDSLNRLKTISYPTGVATSFEYDGGAGGTAQEASELTRITDESGSTQYSHDALGRLVSKTILINGKSFTIGYSWGDAGSALDKLTAIIYPSGSRVNYGYDDKGFINAITVNPVNANGSGPSGSSVTLLSAITYNADNNPTGWLWSDGKARAIGYDSVGLVSSYTLGDPMGAGSAAGTLRSLSRDAAGRITGYSHVNNGAAVTSMDQSFGYDDLNRLTNQTMNGTSITYTYDANGNRTSKTIGGIVYSNIVAAVSNRLMQTQDVTGTANLQYDQDGNVTADGTNTYTYSDRGRMSSATTAGGVVSYLYNGMEQRVQKSGPASLVPTGAAYYLYDHAGRLLGEYDASGSPTYETIYLNMTPVGVMKQTGSVSTNDIAVSLYNVSADHIDTPRLITKQDQTIVWRWDTAEAFGAAVPDQDPSGLGVFVYNPRFPGQVFDAETGLFDNWHRTYGPREGRYRQPDPIGLEGGLNRFAYVEGNPVSKVDPTGEIVTFLGKLAIVGLVYNAVSLYRKYEKLNNDVLSCLAMCRIRDCDDPEHDERLQNNEARCINTCKPTALQAFFGVGKGPTGPKAPTSPPKLFKP